MLGLAKLPNRAGEFSMAYRTFIVSVHDDGTAAEELNRFLRAHRILQVTPRCVEEGANSFWSFLIEYHDPSSTAPQPANTKSKARIDYRDLLSPEDFAVFSRLRDWRREVSQREAIPAYTVLDNDQLAKIVTTRVSTKAALAAIAGIGPSRVEKYGDAIIACLASVWQKAT